MQFLSGQFFRRLLARVRAWQRGRHAPDPVITAMLVNYSSYLPSIHREVSANGVRVFSLCGCCGARLQASATLCEDCAQKRRPARPI
jgi:hypothetical protein